MLKTFGSCAIMCACLVSHAAIASAAEPVGTITFIEGVCDIGRADAEPVMANEGVPVFLHDRIRTKSYSKAKIELADKSVLRLAPSTCITLDQFAMAAGSRQSCIVSLSRGKVQTVVSKTGAPDTFRIKTPNAEGSVKGSDIFVSYLAGKTAVFVQSGSIVVHNPALSHSLVGAAQGECLFVEFGQAPGDVRGFLDVERQQNQRDVEPQLIRKWIPAKDSAEMNAVIVSFTGEVRIFKKGAADFRKVQVNEAVGESDKVQTAEGSSAEIRLSNGNALYLQANTELAFTTLRYDPASGEYENNFDMSVGEVIGVVEKLGNKSTFQLRTPTAVSGVRGTVIRVVVAPPTLEMPKPPTQVFFEGGLGTVTSLTTGQTQQLFAGQNVKVDQAGKISAPAVTLPQQKIAMVQGLPMQQAVNNYMPGKPMAGAGPDMAKPPLPPPLPPMKDGEFGMMPPPPPPPPPFDQVFPPNVLAQIPFVKSGGTHPNIIAANLDLTIKIDGTWNASLNGNYGVADVIAPWTLNLKDLGTGMDTLSFTMGNSMILNGSGVLDMTGSFSLSDDIRGTEPDKDLTVNNFQGDYQSNTFKAQASGTWVDK